MDSEICPQSRQSSTDTRAGYTPTTRPGRSRSMLYYCYCALQSRAASWCYYLIYSIVSTILPATVASLLPIEAVPAVGILLCASSWPVAAAASAQATSDMTMGALEKRVSSALALIDISSTRLQENEAAAISAGAETELLTITKGYPWYAPVHFYLGLISQTRGELELAVEHYSAALRAGWLFDAPAVSKGVYVLRVFPTVARSAYRTVTPGQRCYEAAITTNRLGARRIIDTLHPTIYASLWSLR